MLRSLARPRFRSRSCSPCHVPVSIEVDPILTPLSMPVPLLMLISSYSHSVCDFDSYFAPTVNCDLGPVFDFEVSRSRLSFLLFVTPERWRPTIREVPSKRYLPECNLCNRRIADELLKLSVGRQAVEDGGRWRPRTPTEPTWGLNYQAFEFEIKFVEGAARGRPIIVEWERRKAFGGPLSRSESNGGGAALCMDMSNMGPASVGGGSLRCFMGGRPDGVANLRYFYAGRGCLSLSPDLRGLRGLVR
ncbi:hypothetical protein EVAR_101412_1, partial [Eumeta japonica]